MPPVHTPNVPIEISGKKKVPIDADKELLLLGSGKGGIGEEKKNSGEGYDTDVQSWGVFCLWPQSFQGGDHWAVSFPFIDEGLAPKPFGINDGKLG